MVLCDVGAASAWRAFGATPLPAAASVTVARIAGYGFGILALTNIRRSDELFRVPLSSVLKVERGNDDDVALSIALLSAMADGSQAWAQYGAAVLPPVEELTAAFLWSPRLLAELQHEPAKRRAERCSRRVDVLQRTIARRGRRAVGYGGDSSGVALTEELASRAEWALALVLSRSILLCDESGDPLYRALVPMADLFNHLPESPAEYIVAAAAAGFEDPPPCWLLEGGAPSGSVVVCAATDVPKGGQVLLPYGVETNAELLATHGFLPADNSADFLDLFSGPEAMAEAFASYAKTAGAGWAASPYDDEEGGDDDQDGEALEAEVAEEGRLASHDERLEILDSIDASEAPLAIRPGDSLAACAHVLGAAMLLAAHPAELRCFGEVWSDAAGHAVVAPAVGQRMAGGGAMTAERARELERRAACFLGAAAAAELRQLCALSTPEQDAAQATEVEALVARMQGGDEAEAAAKQSPTQDDSLLGRRRMLLALRYREGVKRLLMSFVQRCDARNQKLG